MPSFVWILAGSAALMAVAALLLFHAISRRMKKLHRELRHEFSRELKSRTAKLSKAMQQTAAEMEQLRGTTRRIEALAAHNRDTQAHLMHELSRISRETPVLRQMAYLHGQNEIHAVATFPKTGGTTIVATLADLFPEKVMPTIPFHSHMLAPSSQSLTSFFEGIISFTSDTPWTAHDDLFPTGWDKKIEVGHSHRLLLKERGCVPLDKARLNSGHGRRSRPERVINYFLTTRDPVAACVSFLFQFVSTWKRWENLSDDALHEYLRSPTSPPLIPSSPGCPWPLVQETWWREQIEQVFGLDFLSLDFDRDRGWQIYDFGQVRFLVIRLENFNSLPEALSTYYDLPVQRIHVIDSNIGEAKGEHGERYRRFRNTVKIPDNLLDMAYSSRFAKHFYSDAELEKFRARWSSAAS